MMNRPITNPVIKIFTFPAIFTIVIFVGFLSNKIVQDFPIVSTLSMEKNLANKKVAIIIAFRDFRDEEYFVPKEVLTKNKAKVTTVSTEQGLAIGADGGEAEVEMTIGDLRAKDFDAILFVGGPGAVRYLDNDISHQIAKDTILEKKILAAICIAPAILAKAGVLAGKKATVWTSSLDKSPIKILEENGAIYTTKSVVADGNIITADGPQSAEEFGEKIVEILTKQ